jgi:hypothetical protein
MSKYAGRKTAIHETVHFIGDWNDDWSNAELRFLAARTKGDRLEKLQDLLPGYGYKRHEVTRKDKFFDPYVGRDYGRRSNEVGTMGIQEFYADPIAFMEKDPDHWDFIYLLLRGQYEEINKRWTP